ncbi:type II toxin-antitoxin system RelE/ParE family toxin [Enterococcus durans]|uniref:type II toxin-antitoxin system RelE/ParE family toxin n=1 Tax=Enterococcus durans TaxID=53345 RepID=UPI00115B17C6|nr:type II toxin-antitoxin system RelE/ParE family toxin [Enterococcus durans]
MVYKVQLSEAAKKDLSDLVDYIQVEFGENIKKRIHIQLTDSLKSLSTFPYKGKSGESLLVFLKGYYCLPLKRNTIFYKVNEEKKLVYVLRIFNNREDAISKLLQFMERE